MPGGFPLTNTINYRVNIFWHALNPPEGFPYRYSFLFSFVLVWVAANFFNYYKELSIYQVSSAILIFVLVLYSLSTNDFYLLEEHSVNWSILFFFAIIGLLFVYQKKKVFYKFLLLSVVSIEIIVNGVLLLSQFDYAPMNQYRSFVSENEPVVDNLSEAEEGELFRMEKLYRYSLNDPLLLNYNGLSHFSSNEQQQVDSAGEISVYENPYAFPLGFSTNLSEANQSEHENPFSYQNELFRALGAEAPIFEEVPSETIEKVEENLEKEVHENGVTYSKIDKEADAFLHYYINTEEDTLINIYFLTEYLDGAEYYINDKQVGTAFNDHYHTIKSFGSGEDPTKFSLKLKDESHVLRYEEEYLYTVNMDEFQKLAGTVQKSAVTFTTFEESYIEATAEVAPGEEQILFTIPYDEAWQVTVDGQSVEPEEAWGIFLSIDVDPGTHEITMNYIPKGTFVGRTLSILSLFVILGIILLRKRTENKEKRLNTKD